MRGLTVFSDGLPDGGLDFNDLHQAAGLDAVRTIVLAAIYAHQASQFNAQAAQNEKTGKCGQSPRSERIEAQNAGGFDRFFVADGDGVYYLPPGDDGGSPLKVCGVLRVVGLARDAHDNQAVLLLEFVTQFGKVRRWLMPLFMLAGDGNAYRTALLSQGFMTPSKSAQRQWLTEYLQSRNPDALELVRYVPRVGWSGRCYVLPNETLGTNPSGEKVIFHSEAGIEANFNQRGNLAQWTRDLARLCVGNSRAVFAVARAFAGVGIWHHWRWHSLHGPDLNWQDHKLSIGRERIGQRHRKSPRQLHAEMACCVQRFGVPGRTAQRLHADP